MPATSAPTAINYDAVGPGWSLSIRPSSMTFQTDQGLATTDNYVEFMPSPDGDTYRGQKITATVTRQGCSIEGYDTTVYPHRVTVMVNGQTLQGCGAHENGSRAAPRETSTVC